MGTTIEGEPPMHVLVAYASRHGATQGIAERIAETMSAAGVPAEARPAASVKSPSEYDAFVVGSAAYLFHWLKDASRFVDRNRTVLAAKPVWLFSSGPIGTDAVNKDGVDQKVATVPKEIAALKDAIHPRDHRVFFGAYEQDRRPVGMMERLVSVMPAARDAFPVGDFRDWPEIEAWAESIARDLLAVPVA
jgi:menaquinone-dependent protoporphyrinogen oxidase